jgi:hypothetical protein
MTNLEEFADDARAVSTQPGSPPNAISAGKLDRNFRRCYPLAQEGNNAPYTVEAGEDGWVLRGEKIFTVCENGQPALYKFFAQRVS